MTETGKELDLNALSQEERLVFEKYGRLPPKRNFALLKRVRNLIICFKILNFI